MRAASAPVLAVVAAPAASCEPADAVSSNEQGSQAHQHDLHAVLVTDRLSPCQHQRNAACPCPNNGTRPRRPAHAVHSINSADAGFAVCAVLRTACRALYQSAAPSPYVAVQALAVCHILQQHLTGMQMSITKPATDSSTQGHLLARNRLHVHAAP